jgi:hypothetical protein
MDVRIWPRKSTDRGGLLMLPLVKKVPSGKNGWEEVKNEQRTRESNNFKNDH